MTMPSILWDITFLEMDLKKLGYSKEEINRMDMATAKKIVRKKIKKENR